jgi:hypothetical protein
METAIRNTPSGSVSAAIPRPGLWKRLVAGITRSGRSESDLPDARLLLPTFEATDQELRLFAEPVFRERIDRIRTEVFTRFVTGCKYP